MMGGASSKLTSATPLVMNWISVSQCTVTLEHLYMPQVPWLGIPPITSCEMLRVYLLDSGFSHYA